MPKTLEQTLSESYDKIEQDVDAAVAEPSEAAKPVAIEAAVDADLPAESVVAPEGEVKAPAAPITQEVDIPAPASLTAAMKAQWKDLPASFRTEFAKHEDERHKAMTRHDGDLQLGREMKEAVSPYMAIIQAEGGTPAKAVSDLLNTAYILRRGTDMQKQQLLREVAQTYGIDVNAAFRSQENVDPNMAMLQREIEILRQQANPEVIKKQLQDEMQNATIASEVTAFASDPANLHYETVLPLMSSLLGTGAATTLKEAYTMACKAHPTISSTLEAEQKIQAEAKKKAEIEAKRKASTSIAGSSGVSIPNTRASKSPEDAVAAAWDSMTGSLIN